jgi:hypothetical protein
VALHEEVMVHLLGLSSGRRCARLNITHGYDPDDFALSYAFPYLAIPVCSILL